MLVFVYVLIMKCRSGDQELGRRGCYRLSRCKPNKVSNRTMKADLTLFNPSGGAECWGDLSVCAHNISGIIEYMLRVKFNYS